MRAAELAVARLSGESGLVPSVEWLLYGAIRKEALLTSQIEGTQATLTDLFDDEAGLAVANTDDVEEVSTTCAHFAGARQPARSAWPADLGAAARHRYGARPRRQRLRQRARITPTSSRTGGRIGSFRVFSMAQDLLREQPVQAATRQQLRAFLPNGGVAASGSRRSASSCRGMTMTPSRCFPTATTSW